MQSADWVQLLRRLPREVHSSMLLGVANGNEIAVQDLLRIDDEFLVARGRVGGTSDAGRVFCLPYNQLTYFLFTHALSEAQMNASFGEMLISLVETGPLAVPPLAEADPKADQPTEPAAAAKVEPATPLSLRERLRARLASGPASGTPPRSG